jgi:hypothetical protein
LKINELCVLFSCLCPNLAGMEISIRIKKRADGKMLPRLACFVKRSHETKAKRFRKWHATLKLADAASWVRTNVVGVVANDGGRWRAVLPSLLKRLRREGGFAAS